MKRPICLLLLCCLILSGCSVSGERIKEPVEFYYVNDGYQKDMDQPIASEMREASGHREDLSYLLALYSMGPSTKDLRSTLPRNTKIIPSERSDDSITLTLSESAQTMTDKDFTLASACLTMTCMELIDVQQVTVVCGDRNITIQADNLLLDHDLAEKSQEETK